MHKKFFYLISTVFLISIDGFFNSSAALLLNDESVSGSEENNTLDNEFDDIPESQEGTEADPFESFNRNMFEFNRGLDTVLFRPLAELYRAGVPSPARDGVHNVVSNLGLPLIFINDALQLDGDRAMETLARFLINSTLGIGGLFDVATEMGVEYHSEDFGQTLAFAGVGGGPYLMLPILGPSNPRDFVGRIVDVFLDPFNTIMYGNGLGSVTYARTGSDLLDRRESSIKFTDRIDQSLDPYAQYRSLYIQNRDYSIRDRPVGSSNQVSREGLNRDLHDD